MHPLNVHASLRLVGAFALLLMIAGLCLLAAGCSSGEPPVSRPRDAASPPAAAPRSTGRDRAPDPAIPPARSPSAAPGHDRQPTQQQQQMRQQQEFLEALMQEHARQQQQQKNAEYERFKRAAEQARICQRCGGAGQYRYVDGRGVLQVRRCPSCRGYGRAF